MSEQLASLKRGVIDFAPDEIILVDMASGANSATATFTKTPQKVAALAWQYRNNQYPNCAYIWQDDTSSTGYKYYYVSGDEIREANGYSLNGNVFTLGRIIGSGALKFMALAYY